jgi:hypothetical protein
MLLMGRGSAPTAVAEPYVQPTLNMTLGLNDTAVPGNRISLELKGVKFESWGVNVPEDDFVMESVNFKALTIRVLDREAPSGGGEAVAAAPSFSENGTA